MAGDEYRVTKAGQLKLWDPDTGEEIPFLNDEGNSGHEKAATSVAFSSDGKYLVTTGYDEKCNVYDVMKLKRGG